MEKKAIKSTSTKNVKNNNKKAASAATTKRTISFEGFMYNPFEGLEEDQIEKKLDEISKALKKENEEKVANGQDTKKGVNRLLVEFYEKECNAPLMKSSSEWRLNEKGKRIVKKGERSKAYYIWMTVETDMEESMKMDAIGLESGRRFVPKRVYSIRQTVSQEYIDMMNEDREKEKERKATYSMEQIRKDIKAMDAAHRSEELAEVTENDNLPF